MAGADENSQKSTSNDPMEDEKIKVMYSVTRMRKLFPKKCSQYISKQLKMEHHILETTDIILDASENVSEESQESDTEMDCDKSHEPVDISALLNGHTDLGKEIDSVVSVLQQVKGEKDCDVIKMCCLGLSSDKS